jgi:hypothetical protein
MQLITALDLMVKKMLPAAADHLLHSAAASRTKSSYRLGAWPDQRGQRSNIGVARSEATVLVSLEHKPEVHSVPSGEDLTDLLLERVHRKVGVTNLLVQNLTPNGRGTGSA